MSKELKLEAITLELFREYDGVRVFNALIPVNTILGNLAIDQAATIIKENFVLVNNYYKEKVENSKGVKFDLCDINQLSTNIVLHYLYMYNNWKNTYRKMQNLSLSFKTNDFNDPNTFDLVAYYFKKRYPQDWSLMSAILLGVTSEEFINKYQEREKFYNK